MSHPVGSLLRDRIEVEFVEANVEIGFNLVDLAEAECGCGNPTLASRVLKDAEEVYCDIERRLQRLTTADRGCFDSLIHELRREIDQAQSHRSTLG